MAASLRLYTSIIEVSLLFEASRAGTTSLLHLHCATVYSFPFLPSSLSTSRRTTTTTTIPTRTGCPPHLHRTWMMAPPSTTVILPLIFARPPLSPQPAHRPTSATAATSTPAPRFPHPLRRAEAVAKMLRGTAKSRALWAETWCAVWHA